MNKVLVFLLLCFYALINSCAGSYHNMVVSDRATTYNQSLDAFKEKEHEYLILLGNLENYPDEEYLLQRKKEIAGELDQLRALVKLSRKELDESIASWETNIAEGKKDTKTVQEIFDDVKKKAGRAQDRPEWEGFQ